MANLLQVVIWSKSLKRVIGLTLAVPSWSALPIFHFAWLTNLPLLLDDRGDVVEIETWCQGEGRIHTRRDWILKDFATGEVIGRATRLAFPEEDSSSLKKIPKLEDPAEYSRLGLVPRRADLDMNQHVNNVTYIGWVLESMPQDVIDTHELQKITLDYRRECQHNDVVDSLTSLEVEETVSELNGTNGSATSRKNENDCCQFLHFLRLSGDGLEINRGRTEWRSKPRR
ncbi:Oleoyl-acyl carrier protein thioesterase 2, chloroplastic [Asimina triloba]